MLKHSFMILIHTSLLSCGAGVNSYASTELEIEKFLSEKTNCSVDIEVINVHKEVNILSLKGSSRYLVNAQICEYSDKYFFWLQSEELRHKILSYTSFSQPE